ncbi:MAG: septum formation initiator family protein [Clostridia bacterium]|nr:septum formation initiator family protein [Clostridia bacterium]
MANTRVTTAQENPLCTRLKSKFDTRGMNSTRVHTGAFNTVRKETAFEKRAKTIVSPYEETAQFVRSDVRTNKKASAETVRFGKVATDKAACARRRTEAYERTSPFASGAYAAAYARAAEIRARAMDGTEARMSAEREAMRKKKAKGNRAFSLSWFKGILLGNDEEVVVKKAPISVSFIIGIVLFAVVVMMILFSLAQISEFKKEISTLEAQREELVCDIEELCLNIDMKNDIRMIEQTATEEYGMVKSNRVESRYISVAEGERVELPETAEAENDYGIFSTMMSSVSSNWDKLMEYID